MLGFELAQLAYQRVELGVGELGLVEDEVALVVVLDQLAQLRPHALRPRRACSLPRPKSTERV